MQYILHVVNCKLHYISPLWANMSKFEENYQKTTNENTKKYHLELKHSIIYTF